jgi:GntR family transcriptional repressor for pyruvate dehydrogenase complex
MNTEPDTPSREARRRGKSTAWSGQQLTRVRSVSPREAVSEQILGLIRSGVLRPGDRLPSEQELMAMTSVSRPSVREAIRSLASLRLVEIRRGKGTFVQEIAADGLTEGQVVLMLADRRALEDLVEVRQALEPLVARLAAERADDEDARALDEAIQGMRGAPDHEAWRVAHLDFHRLLARATHNVILAKMWALIQTFLKDSPMVTGTPSRPQVHDELYAAIAAHDPDRAAMAMDRHLTDMRRIVE